VHLAVNLLLLGLAVGLLIPVAVLFLECAAAVLLRRRSADRPEAPRPSVAVLIPAHDEEPGIGATISSLLPQLTREDRLLVVADNCADGTAEAARRAGATVIERYDPERRGKGYALAYGIDYLRDDPPDVVVLLDADTQVDPNALVSLVRAAWSTGCPAQAVNLLDPPLDPAPRDRISCLAFTIKNLVRPTGLAALGLPCPLTMGVAMPWAVAARAPLASGSIVEDMQLGLDLAIAGHPPRFCPQALVKGRLPGKETAAVSQRTRWEHGHLQTLLRQTPRLLREALKQRRGDLLAMALDLAVPPLSLLLLAWTVAAGGALVAWLLGASPWPAALLGVSGAMLAGAVLMAWGRFGREIIPLRVLLRVPVYVAWKVPIYLAFLINRQKTWLRTERDACPASQACYPRVEDGDGRTGQ